MYQQTIYYIYTCCFASIFVFLMAGVMFFAPTPSLAASTGGIVPCGNNALGTSQDACTICDLIEGVHGIVQKLMSWMIVAGLFIITIAGITYIVSAGNQGLTAMAKKAVINTLVGVTVILVAFLGITFILNNIFDAKTEMITDGGLTIARNTWTFSCSKYKAPPSSGGGGTATGGGAPSTPQPHADQPAPPPGNLAKGCDNYDSAFNKASAGDQDLKCLLKGIAMAESTCNPAAQNGRGCGLMQIESDTCQYYKDNPEASIMTAAEMLRANKAQWDKYNHFSIGSGFGQGSGTVQYGGVTYSTGNDDLIASYNAGTGGSLAKNPFHTSSDCPDTGQGATPAWQCNINPGGFGSTTQRYVPNVQKYQRECLAGN